MTPEDVIDVLSFASAYDGRTVGQVDVMAWSKVIGGYERDDALEAVARHFTESRERVMPADVIRHIRGVRDERRRAQHSDPLALPSRYEDDAERDARNKAARERLHREVLAPLAAKRDLARALREQETADAIEAARLRFAAGSEWQMTPNAKTGVWWDDPAARERHCQELLAS
jgi:hypothetical protein